MRIVIAIIVFLFAINSISQQKKHPEFHLYPDKKGDKWGYLKNKRKLVINYQFEEAYKFKEGLALVKKDGKYGFIEPTGKIKIDCIYDRADGFYDSFAWVQKDSLCGMLKKDGTLFKGQLFTQIFPFREGFAKIVFKNDGVCENLDDPYVVAFFDRDGKQLADQFFSGAGNFKDGHAKVSISGEYFYLDTLGRLLLRTKEKFDEATPYIPVNLVELDQMPQFPGGEMGLITFLAINTKYPLLAREFGITGVVHVRFKINTKGEVEDAKIAVSVHDILDKEALRVINKLPKWKPGIKDGKPVNVYYTVPISFSPRNN